MTRQRRGARLIRLALTVGAAGLGGALLSAIFGTSPAATIIAILIGYIILRSGWFFLRTFATPPPEPPEPGTLRKVKLTYRCPVCGAEVRMTVAATEDPEPPRHCMEDMELVTPED